MGLFPGKNNQEAIFNVMDYDWRMADRDLSV
jgi:hypothetical protein